jgi:hypothetical protein
VAFLCYAQEDAMPLNTLIILLATVIALAGATVAGLLLFTETLTGSPLMVLALLTIVSLCATVALRLYRGPGDES